MNDHVDVTEPIVKQTKPLWWFNSVHYALIGLATPPFLFCLIRVVMPPVNIKIVPAPGWPEALVIADYIGLLMRKEWAYMLFVIISVILEVLFIHSMISLYSSLGYLDKEYALYAIWSGLILLSASICGLTCRRQRNDLK